LSTDHNTFDCALLIAAQLTVPQLIVNDSQFLLGAQSACFAAFAKTSSQHQYWFKALSFIMKSLIFSKTLFLGKVLV
jgi:hypothetical protein